MSHDPLAVDAIFVNESGVNAIGTSPLIEPFQFDDGDRWSTTFTNGGGLTQGDPTTLRWGIVTDGTAISGGFGEPASGSSLIQFMDNLYGDNGVPDNGDLTLKPWFTIFSSSFDRVSQISGLTFTYLAINSQSTGFVSIADGSTSSATIPEVLIGGHFIDGQSGSNTLAYNYFPGTGDMVIDTGNTSFFGNSTNSSVGMRNVLMHEAGHGVGISHVESSNGDFLMEPFINTAFDGPQFDDILAFQRGYGDVLEKNGGNNTSGTATSLGAIGSGGSVSRGTSAGSSTIVSATATDFTSIDDESDLDFFSFSVASTGTTTITLTPKGPTYQQGPQSNPQNSFNAATQNDLTLQLIGPNGTTVLQTANLNGLGGTETITNASLGAAGTYFVRVSGATTNAIQLYQLDVAFANSTPPPPTSTLSISDAQVTEGNSGTTTLTFNVTLSAATSTGFTVQFVTQDGTATVANNDYVPILAANTLRVGSFDESRGGIFSLSNGSSAAAMRSAIQSNFAGATFSGASTLTAAFLSTVDVVWLNSVASNTASTTPLSAAEQAALLNFVNAGGGVLIFGENDFFDDESLLAPFGATSTGSLFEVQTGTISNTSHPVTNGPFGAVQTIRGNYPGNLTTLGSATSLGTWNSGNQSSLAVIDPGVLSSGSGRVLLFSDVNFYADQLGAADNSKLMLNALKSAQPSNRLTFAGTAGETKMISVTVNGDTQIEPNETLTVVLSNLSGSNEVTIADGTGVGTINNDDAATPPVITSNGGGNTASINVVENTTAVTTVTATDPGDTLTFSITGGADFSKFTIHPTTGVLSFLSAPDFEAPTDAGPNNVYEVTVTVTDSTSQTDSQALSVTVTNVVNETAALSINDTQVAEGNSGTSTLTFTVTLSAATSTGFTVQFVTQDGTALVSNNDYLPITASGNLRIGSFDGSRGGIFSLANGTSAAAMRTAIQSNFAGSTITGTSTLTAAFLANIDVLWLNSVASNTSATTALSAAEQSALLSF
ncbi:MAG: Calx-beta domain-containing protein, partial [Planctomycetaceae bacterium]